MTHQTLADLLKKGILAKKEGDKRRARLLFSRALQLDPQNENGWLWLASVAESSQQAAAMIDRVLQINPRNEKALRLHYQLKGSPPKPVEKPISAPTTTSSTDEIPTAPPKPPTAPLTPRPKARGYVLVVDDSITVRNLVSMTLKRRGYKVVQAADGVEALSKLDKLVPDLILLDINMPRMDGYQVCRAIRSNRETSHVPVVMLSGRDGFFDRIKGRIAGATEYISKPFAPRDLITAVEKRMAHTQ